MKTRTCPRAQSQRPSASPRVSAFDSAYYIRCVIEAFQKVPIDRDCGRLQTILLILRAHQHLDRRRCSHVFTLKPPHKRSRACLALLHPRRRLSVNRDPHERLRIPCLCAHRQRSEALARPATLGPFGPESCPMLTSCALSRIVQCPPPKRFTSACPMRAPITRSAPRSQCTCPGTMAVRSCVET